MSILKRIEKIEKKLPDDNLLPQIIFICFGRLDNEPMLKRQSENARNYIEAHPEVWDSLNTMKVLLVFVSTTGWKIDHLHKSEEANSSDNKNTEVIKSSA